MKFLSDHGIDVVAIINTIHDVLGLPPFQPKQSTRRGVGINGLIDDVIAVLPLDDLRALFDEKLKNSEDFRALVEAIQSPEFAVRIHCFNLSYVPCLLYVHTFV